MAKKKAEQRIKRLKRKAKEARTARLALEKRVRKLEKKLDAREQRITSLKERLGDKPPATEVRATLVAELGDRDGTGIVSSHRAAWKQHSFLRDRYEFHLNAGSTKELARHLANEDLKQSYGADRGYTEEELSAILS